MYILEITCKEIVYISVSHGGRVGNENELYQLNVKFEKRYITEINTKI